MGINDYADVVSTLCNSNNTALKEAGEQLRCVFYEDENSPTEQLMARREKISGDVRNFFPSRLAESYDLLHLKVNDFQSALDSNDEKNLKRKFEDMFVILGDTWNMLLNFFPFLFLLSLSKMDNNLIATHGADRFYDAFLLYKRIFHDSGNIEAELMKKGELTIELLNLFRELHSCNAIEESFIFWPLMRGDDGDQKLLPHRFDSIIKLFWLLNDKEVKKALAGQNTNMLKSIFDLVNMAVLDITETIMPIFESFHLVYIEEIYLDEEPYKTKGISISGIGQPKNVYFRLLAGAQSDLDSLQESNLYLVNREKQISKYELDSNTREYLTPEDYMKLPPLLLYTTLGFPQGSDLAYAESPDEDDLFAFYGYEEREEQQYLKYLKFSETKIEEIIKREKSKLYTLFEDYEIFSKNLMDCHKDIEKKKINFYTESLPEEEKIFDFIFRKTWELSLGHISGLLRIDEYDSDARLKEIIEKRNKKVKFIEGVYVTPKEQKLLDDFIVSGKRGFILIGKSGMGKSNLLCAFFLKQRRKEDLNIFIDARRLNSIDIRHYLNQSITKRINEDWGLKEFDNYLQSTLENLTIFIDAVNEFNNVGGAVGLLEQICGLIEDAHIFKNIKIIVSCRNETWDQYKIRIGTSSTILNTDYFFPSTGDAVAISGFESHDERKELYEKYQDYYELNPDSYNGLKPEVRELLKQPFMMGLIAEIYSNIPGDFTDSPVLKTKKEIPGKLDYFTIFQLLTDRKKEDAKRLLSDASDMELVSFERSFEECLFRFAGILYDKIKEPSKKNTTGSSDDKSDSLPRDQLYKDEIFHDFAAKHFDLNNKTTAFSAVIQVGLIDRIFVDEYDYHGSLKSGRAYKYFHDQYTQFWLSAVYNGNHILGNIHCDALRSNASLLEKTAKKIAELLERSKDAPVISGGLYHWLYNRIFDKHGSKRKNLNDFLPILFSRLAEMDSNIVHYFLGSFLHWLIAANHISAKDLYKNLVEKGNDSLRKCFHEHILQAWPEIPPDTLQAILELEENEKLLRGISIIFVNLFRAEPGEVIEYIDKALKSIEKISTSLFNINQLKKSIPFAMTFFISALLGNIRNIDNLTIIGGFLKKKYKLLFNIITDLKAKGIKSKVQDKIYNHLDRNGLNLWDTAVATQGGNENFFKEDNGLVQRDVLRAFYKFCVDFNNDKNENFSLEKNSEYMAMTLKMMGYRNRSLIGYVATIMLVTVLTDRFDKLDDIIGEIIDSQSVPALTFSIAMLHMLSKSREDKIDSILDIIHHKLLPKMIHNLGKDDYAITSFFVMGATDFNRYWPKCEEIFTSIIDYLRERGEKQYINKFGEMLIEPFFPPDESMGVKITEYVLDNKLHEELLFKEFALTMLACMLARSPIRLKSILEEKGVDDSIINDARPFLTESIIEARSEVSFKHGWNNFFVYGLLKNKELKYLLVKYLLGSLVQADNEKDFIKKARRFLIVGIKIFLVDNNEPTRNFGRLTVEEVLGENNSRK